MILTALRPRKILLIIFFLLLASYALFQARFLLGPQIKITSPQNGQSINEPLVIVEGRSKNVAWLSLNDRQIFTDETGLWSEKLIVSPGLSIIKVRGTDRFGRETTKQIEILLQNNG